MPPSSRPPIPPRMSVESVTTRCTNQERQSKVIRHEGPYRCRCQKWTDSQPKEQSANEHELNLNQVAENREVLADVKFEWAIAMCPNKLKELIMHPRKNKVAITFKRLKSSIIGKVKYPFRFIKRQFGFVKARYKGLRKNDSQLAMLFTLANLFRVAQMIRTWDSCVQNAR